MTADYNGIGKKLLLAESILIACNYYDDTTNRGPIYPNNYEHSRIRAYLNGLSYNKSGNYSEEFKEKGFLQSAFTSTAQNKILTTIVDNSVESTTDFGSEMQQAFDYACSDTADKIFLLSEMEATTTHYGFVAFFDGYSSGTGSVGIRKPTDFAMSTGTYTAQFYNGCGDLGGFWWLRSPNDENSSSSHNVYSMGEAYDFRDVWIEYCGVVPALCIE